MTTSEALAPLRERNFRLYFSSRVVNLLGSLMAPVALAFAVLEISDSPTALGVVLAAHSIPMVAFLLAGGVLADRFGRTLVIQSSNVVAGLTQLAIAALVVSGTAEIWHLVVLTAVNGVAAAAALPALASVLPQLVPREQLQQANVLVSMVRSGLSVLGPTVSSLIVVGVGPGWALAVDGLAYLGAAALLAPIRLPRPVRAAGGSVVRDLREGWGYFRSTTWLWVVVLAFSVICAVHQGGFFTLGPVLAKDTAIGERGWGLILSAEALGLLVTGLALLRLRLERPLFWGMLGTVLYAAPLVALGLTDSVLLVVLAAFVAGAGIEVFGLGWQLAMQENVPDDMLSRAFSFDALGSFAAIPLGQLVAGPLALAFGLQPVMLVAGLSLAAVALLTLLSPSVRYLQRADAAVGVPAPAPAT
ncbi:MFS transporter [Nocardioides ginkgobilobae]